MNTITTNTSTLLVILPARVFEQDAAENSETGSFAGYGIFFTVSVGLVIAPSFLGSSETSVYARPDISVAIGDRLNISLLKGMSYDVYKGDQVSAGVVLRYVYGREDVPPDHELLLSNVPRSEALSRIGSCWLCCIRTYSPKGSGQSEAELAAFIFLKKSIAKSWRSVSYRFNLAQFGFRRCNEWP